MIARVSANWEDDSIGNLGGRDAGCRMPQAISAHERVVGWSASLRSDCRQDAGSTLAEPNGTAARNDQWPRIKFQGRPKSQAPRRIGSGLRSSVGNWASGLGNSLVIGQWSLVIFRMLPFKLLASRRQERERLACSNFFLPSNFVLPLGPPARCRQHAAVTLRGGSRVGLQTAVWRECRADWLVRWEFETRARGRTIAPAWKTGPCWGSGSGNHG